MLEVQDDGNYGGDRDGIAAAMTMMMGKLYAALRAANAPEAEAREAAEEAAAVHDRFDTLDRGLEAVRIEVADLRGDVKSEIANLRGDVKSEIADLRGELRTEITGIRGELRTEITGVRGELRRLEWMLAGLLVIALAVASKYFLR
jgi:hypothetical protein